MFYTLFTPFSLAYRKQLLKETAHRVAQPSWSDQGNTVWRDGVVYQLGPDWCKDRHRMGLTARKGYPVHWVSQPQIAVYPQGGIWDWHCDQIPAATARHYFSFKSSLRSVSMICSIKGSILVNWDWGSDSLAAGDAITVPSDKPYRITSVTDASVYTVWGMRWNPNSLGWDYSHGD